MRAAYVPQLTPAATVALTGEVVHHLVNVVRLEVGDELMLLNGQGLQLTGTVELASKKELRVKILEEKVHQRSVSLDVALGIPKKDALDLCLKQACELGLRRIYLVRAEYSQQRIPEAERIHNLIVSALEQSNAPFLPTVIEASWEEVPFASYGEVTLLDSQTRKTTSATKTGEDQLLVVGPEGGFSTTELARFERMTNLCRVHLPTPILRTPTALATGTGLILKSLLDRGFYANL
jgi:16S rRNA (uracil1498-N3)-methyltransferase